MSVRTDETLGRVYRRHRWWGPDRGAVDQIAAFYAACEVADAPADGAELHCWRRSTGAALTAWRRVPRSERRRLTERWRMAAECFLRGLDRRAA